MKGAIGNAFIMNMVITFILIFYVLLIGSMAYSKAYKTNNYLLEWVMSVDSSLPSKAQDKVEGGIKKAVENNDFDIIGNLQRLGYIIATETSCPTEKNGYTKRIYPGTINPTINGYDFCVFLNYKKSADFADGTPEKSNSLIYGQYNYMVMSYMKFDFPIIGQFIKIPITGETKTFTIFKGDI